MKDMLNKQEGSARSPIDFETTFYGLRNSTNEEAADIRERLTAQNVAAEFDCDAVTAQKAIDFSTQRREALVAQLRNYVGEQSTQAFLRKAQENRYAAIDYLHSLTRRLVGVGTMIGAALGLALLLSFGVDTARTASAAAPEAGPPGSVVTNRNKEDEPQAKNSTRPTTTVAGAGSDPELGVSGPITSSNKIALSVPNQSEISGAGGVTKTQTITETLRLTETRSYTLTTSLTAKNNLGKTQELRAGEIVTNVEKIILGVDNITGIPLTLRVSFNAGKDKFIINLGAEQAAGLFATAEPMTTYTEDALLELVFPDSVTSSSQIVNLREGPGTEYDVKRQLVSSTTPEKLQVVAKKIIRSGPKVEVWYQFAPDGVWGLSTLFTPEAAENTGSADQETRVAIYRIIENYLREDMGITDQNIVNAIINQTDLVPPPESEDDGTITGILNSHLGRTVFFEVTFDGTTYKFTFFGTTYWADFIRSIQEAEAKESQAGVGQGGEMLPNVAASGDGTPTVGVKQEVTATSVPANPEITVQSIQEIETSADFTTENGSFVSRVVGETLPSGEKQAFSIITDQDLAEFGKISIQGTSPETIKLWIELWLKRRAEAYEGVSTSSNQKKLVDLRPDQIANVEIHFLALEQSALQTLEDDFRQKGVVTLDFVSRVEPSTTDMLIPGAHLEQTKNGSEVYKLVFSIYMRPQYYGENLEKSAWLYVTLPGHNIFLPHDGGFVAGIANQPTQSLKPASFSIVTLE